MPQYNADLIHLASVFSHNAVVPSDSYSPASVSYSPATYTSQPSQHTSYQPQPEKVNYVIDQVSGPSGSSVKINRYRVNGRSYVPGETDQPDDTFPRGRYATPYDNYAKQSQNREYRDRRIDYHQGKENIHDNDNSEVVHGSRNLPKVYLVRNGKVMTLAQKRKNYRDRDLAKYETDVHVQSVNELANRGRSSYERGAYGPKSLRKREDETLTREYVDHTQRQRHIESKDREGTDNRVLAQVGLGENHLEPTVNNRQLQHYATFDIGNSHSFRSITSMCFMNNSLPY